MRTPASRRHAARSSSRLRRSPAANGIRCHPASSACSALPSGKGLSERSVAINHKNESHTLTPLARCVCDVGRLSDLRSVPRNRQARALNVAPAAEAQTRLVPARRRAPRAPRLRDRSWPRRQRASHLEDGPRADVARQWNHCALAARANRSHFCQPETRAALTRDEL